MELLAPAADPEVFRAVVDAGADAVYFGGTAFGARAQAASFDAAAAYDAVTYAHLRGRKTWLTVNTLLRNEELEQELYPFLCAYYNAGVDGVIVQDPGVLSLLRECFPDWKVSASTQMTVTTAEGARWLKAQGVQRMVAPRELSLEEIRAIAQAGGPEVEVFVHGALCVCYSGHCLMSSMIGQRSGNRGRCAQPCRLPYDVLEDGSALRTKGPYVLSLKDLCGIRDLPALEAAGVASLKIEGRLKGAAYAAGVTAIYRRVLDAMEAGEDPVPLMEEGKRRLLDLGNRGGFTDLYYRAQNGASMVTFSDSAHHHVPASEDGKTDSFVAFEQIPVSAVFCASDGVPMQLELCAPDGTCIRRKGDPAQPAKSRPTTPEEIRKQLQKTGNTPFVFSQLTLACGENLFLPVRALNELRRQALADLQRALVLPDRRPPLPFRELSAPARIPWDLPRTAEASEDGPTGKTAEKDPVEAVSVTLLTVRAWNQLEAICADSALAGAYIAVPATLCAGLSEDRFAQCTSAVRRAGMKLLLWFPPVLRARGMRLLRSMRGRMDACDGVLCGSLDGLAYLESLAYPPDRIWADTGLYTWSDRAIELFRNRGIQHYCAPLELNLKQLRARDAAGAVYAVYGRAPLMVMSNCIRQDVRGCDHTSGALELRDRRKQRFPVANDCKLCMNTVYNSVPLSLIGQWETEPLLAAGGRRLDFTFETPAEVQRICRAYASHEPWNGGPRTRGHYCRGVL